MRCKLPLCFTVNSYLELYLVVLYLISQVGFFGNREVILRFLHGKGFWKQFTNASLALKIARSLDVSSET